MASLGKLEGQITIPATGMFATFTDSAGIPFLAAIPAGTYYHSTPGSTGRTIGDELVNVTASMLNAWTFVMGSDGKYTITTDGANFSIVWTEPALADILGFSGDIATTATATGTLQARGLWFASQQHQILNGSDDFKGYWETDKQSLENMSGLVYGIMGRKKRILDIVWPAESANKCWIIDEITGGESFEQFYLDSITGSSGWGTPCGPIRWHPNAAAATIENRISESSVLRVSESDVQRVVDGASGGSASYATYSIPGMKNWRPDQLVQHWSGRWRLEIPRLVQAPE